MTTDLRPLHIRALSEASRAIDASAALTDPTPCGDWDLGDLLNHMVGQNNGFALAVETGDATVADYAGPGRELARSSWPASVERLTAAFANADLDAQLRLVEISPELRFPVGVASASNCWTPSSTPGTSPRLLASPTGRTTSCSRPPMPLPGGYRVATPGPGPGPRSDPSS